MTSPPLETFGPERRRPSGFTLTELLVVIGILVLVLSLIVGAVRYAQQRARDTQARSEMQIISMALEQYKADFKNYPMRMRPGDPSVPGNDPLILAWALIGPGPNPGPNGKLGFGQVWANPPAELPGGFRTVANGNIYPSYLATNSFTTVHTARGWEMRGIHEVNIEYYPKRGEYGLGNANGSLVGPALVKGARYRFEVTDGNIPQAILQERLGDRNKNNLIDRTATPAESLQFSGPYILASPGPNGLWEDPLDSDASRRSSDDVFYDPGSP